MASDSDESDIEHDVDALTDAFNKACQHVAHLTTSKTVNLTDANLLELYGLYKIATVGVCTEPKPGFFQMRAAKKWHAWHALGDMTTNVGKQKYIDLVMSLDTTWTPELSEKCHEKAPAWINVSSLARTRSSESVNDASEHIAFNCVKNNEMSQLVDILTSDSAIINEYDASGMALLHWACDRGNDAIVNVLIEHGADVNAKTLDDGQTPLHYAASCGYYECVSALLRHGADRHATDNDGLTAVDVADDDAIVKLVNN